MDQPPSRSPQTIRTMETMLAELVHHVAEMVNAQKETNRLLTNAIDTSKKKEPGARRPG